MCSRQSLLNIWSRTWESVLTNFAHIRLHIPKGGDYIQKRAACSLLNFLGVKMGIRIRRLKPTGLTGSRKKNCMEVYLSQNSILSNLCQIIQIIHTSIKSWMATSWFYKESLIYTIALKQASGWKASGWKAAIEKDITRKVLKAIK